MEFHADFRVQLWCIGYIFVDNLPFGEDTVLVSIHDDAVAMSGIGTGEEPVFRVIICFRFQLQ